MLTPLENLSKKPAQRRLVIAAAIMRSNGLSREEIGKALKRSPSAVTKLLKLAEDAGYLSSAPTFLRHKVNDADFAEVRRSFFGETDFTEELRAVVPTPKDLKVEPKPAVFRFAATVMMGSYPEFIHAAAVHVCHLLRKAQLLGLMWGRTVHLLVENIRACGEHLDHDAFRDIVCVPLCRDPTHLMNERRLEFSASWLAGELERALRRPAAYRPANPCLIGVPAYLSRAVREGAKEDGGSLFKHLHAIPGYQVILGRDPARPQRLADKVDSVIMGAGIIGPEYAQWSPERPDFPATGDLIAERLLQEEDVRKEDLARLIFGDVGGVLLERPDLGAKDHATVESLNAGWTGLKESDLQRIAAAASDKGAGIVLVASSAAKAEVLLAAIQRGLVNRIIVDMSLKERLVELARAAASKAGAKPAASAPPQSRRLRKRPRASQS
ncbi:MAG TPA: hypothetical protein PKI20_11230 [Verrucomicrobiota bacterium]|nr:hypothetical protein [Verrucomicrobiota bacterium]HQL78163.1 hypothetical protein [Verrucomicrobiota bacterium]